MDVGGGIGHVSLEIAKLRPDLNIIVEDRALVLEQAKEVCRPILSFLLSSNIFSVLASVPTQLCLGWQGPVQW